VSHGVGNTGTRTAGGETRETNSRQTRDTSSSGTRSGFERRMASMASNRPRRFAARSEFGPLSARATTARGRRANERWQPR